MLQVAAQRCRQRRQRPRQAKPRTLKAPALVAIAVLRRPQVVLGIKPRILAAGSVVVPTAVRGPIGRRACRQAVHVAGHEDKGPCQQKASSAMLTRGELQAAARAPRPAAAGPAAETSMLPEAPKPVWKSCSRCRHNCGAPSRRAQDAAPGAARTSVAALIGVPRAPPGVVIIRVPPRALVNGVLVLRRHLHLVARRGGLTRRSGTAGSLQAQQLVTEAARLQHVAAPALACS